MDEVKQQPLMDRYKKNLDYIYELTCSAQEKNNVIENGLEFILPPTPKELKEENDSKCAEQYDRLDDRLDVISRSLEALNKHQTELLDKLGV